MSNFKETLKNEQMVQAINEFNETHGIQTQVQPTVNGAGCTVYGGEVFWESRFLTKSNEGDVRQKVYVNTKYNGTTSHFEFAAHCPQAAYQINAQSDQIIEKFWTNLEEWLGFKVDNQVKDSMVKFDLIACHRHATSLRFAIERRLIGLDPKDYDKTIELASVMMAASEKIMESMDFPVVKPKEGTITMNVRI